MELSAKNMLRIVSYLKGTDAFSVHTEEQIAYHLDRLSRIGQLEAAEAEGGKLVYAFAYWRLTDRILEDTVTNFVSPKRIDRGRNIMGLFFMNDVLSTGSMLAVIKRVLAQQKAKSLTIYTSRKKWWTTQVKRRKGGAMADTVSGTALDLLRRAS